MIIVKLMGGLGNQLFQYAAGKALAMKHNVPLKLDLSFLNSDPKNQHVKRELELNVFRLDYEICNEAELKLFENNPRVKKILHNYLPFLFSSGIIANEKGFEFNENFFSYPKDTYLNGFWQSEKYFKSIRETLVKEIVIQGKMSEECELLSNSIVHSNSVSLHIRRGDYVTHKNAKNFHGVLSLDYYSKAISFLNSKFSDLKFFIFSDDITWVKSNLKLENEAVYIDFNAGNKSAYDLYLMSLCKHNIIANSSFSWWGAWLNQNENKIVIAPEKWFLDKSVNTIDLLPLTWIKL